MNILDRAILALYSLVIGVFSFVLILVPFYEDAYWWTSRLLEIYRFDWQYIIIPILLFSISFWFLVSGIRSHSSKNKGIIKHTAYGEIKISLNTIESLAQKSVREINGLRDIRATVHPLTEGLVIYIHTLALPDINIPETTIMVQQTIKEYIEQYTGIEVKEIKVSIDDIASLSKGRVD